MFVALKTNWIPSQQVFIVLHLFCKKQKGDADNEVKKKENWSYLDHNEAHLF